MNKGLVKTIKLLIVIAIVGAFVWFLVLSPMITFRNNEKTLEEAARRYFELNKEQLPTGERVKTLSLNTLYKKSYLKEDFKTPYAGQLCSLEKSWVKVRRVNGEYKYYVFLDCGTLKSSIDHTGPQIKLKGKDELTISMGDEYKDAGISSVVDDTDGKISVENVTVSGEVNTEKTGTYEITYSVLDSLNNKTVVKRTIHVVKVLNSFVKNELKDEKVYKGDPENNYVRLSNMVFRIMGLDNNDNVVLVAEEDVANVNFTKIEKWLDEEYIPRFTDEAKKLLVETEFCNMKVDETEVDTITKCTSTTKKRYAYIPSIIDVNLAKKMDNQFGVEQEFNFLRPLTMSWVGNNKNSKEAYTVRNVFFDTYRDARFYADDSTFNYGVRPKIVMKGDTLIVAGDGTASNPYSFGETKKAKGGSLLNTRYSGEYITSNGYLWRIIEIMNDGTTKVISDDTLGDGTFDRPMTSSYPGYLHIKYDTKDKLSHAYFINNKASEYIDVSIFSTHEIDIPVYKNKIVYGEADKYNTIKVKLTAPSMYDLFSAQVNKGTNVSHSYWLCDTVPSKERIAGAMTDIGVPVNQEIPQYYEYGVRVVGFLKKGTVISNGDGTYESPYKLK